MKKEFPPVVLEVLKDMEMRADERLPIMQKFMRNEDVFINMWRHILRSERREMYASMNETEVVHGFLDAVIHSSKEEIPVFYLDEKSKKEKIEKIRKAQEKLKSVYIELFADEALAFIEALDANTATAIKKVEDSYLRATGDPKVRKIHTFIREMAQNNLWVYGEQLHSVIRTAVLGLYDYTINHDANILKITRGPEEEPISFEALEHLLSGQ